MARKLTKAEQAARDAHFAEFDRCWLCEFLERKQTTDTQLHHIVGRGKGCECRENFCDLCRDCHWAIHTGKGVLICLALVREFNPEFYSPETLCSLRRYSPNYWTDADVDGAASSLVIMRSRLKRNF